MVRSTLQVRVFAVLAACVLLAGCTEQADAGHEAVNLASPEPQAETAAPLEGARAAGHGIIRGVVVDEQIRPILGARVIVVGVTFETTTDEDGAFVFEGLADGLYRVRASKDRHVTQEILVDLTGSTASAKILLLVDPEMVPYHTTHYLRGFQEYPVSSSSFWYQGGHLWNPDCACAIDFEVDRTPHSFLVEAAWEDSMARPDGEPTEWKYKLEHAETRNYVVGTHPSPMWDAVRIGAFHAAKNSDSKWWNVLLNPDSSWPVLNQEFQLFVTVFYVDGPSDGWTAWNSG